MDAITLLKDDHRDLEKLFKRFERAGDRAFVTKRQIVDKIIEDLSVHAAVEEQVFYPVARAAVPDTEALALESLEEHHVVKVLLHELEDMSPEDERFDAKVAVLIENVRHHVDEEESEFFPMVREEVGRNALQDVAEAMLTARKVAPTRPHPDAPDTPPANYAVGVGAGVVDRMRDTVSGVAQGSVTAVNDVIATVLRRERRQPAPTGSSLSRSAAAKVRAEVADATQSVIDTIEQALDVAESAGSAAKDGAQRTASAAKRSATTTARRARSGAKATVTSSTSSAKEVKRTAKAAATSTGRAARRTGKETLTTAENAAEDVADAVEDARAAG